MRRGGLRYSLTVLTDVAQLSSEFFTSFAVGGVAGLRTLGVAILTAAACEAAFAAEVVVVVAAKDVLAKSKTKRVSGCILKGYRPRIDEEMNLLSIYHMKQLYKPAATRLNKPIKIIN